jgi:leukotriene-A4 hydrolase
MAKVKKDDKFFDFDAIGGWSHLSDDVKILPPNFSRLIPILDGTDPDDSFSGVPYEKGFNLLYALEKRVGTPAFEEFAKNYLKRFKFVTITSAEFKTYFESYFAPGDALVGFDWNSWFHTPGMPVETPVFDKTLSKASEDLGASWIAYDQGKGALPSVDISPWITNQKTCFLDSMLLSLEKAGDCNLKSSTCKAMDEQYHMSTSKNSEVLCRYCKLAIGAEEESIVPIALKFITTMGRMVSLIPNSIPNKPNEP